MEFIKDFALSEYTTWKIGGVADWGCQPTSIEDVQAACRWAQEKKQPITVVSGGSNVLISDQGVEGLVLVMNQLSGITNIQYENSVLSCECLAGTPKSDLLKVFVKQKLSPAIFLAGLPGDIGGGVVMNAGVGHDVSPKEFVEITKWFEYIPTNSSGETIVRVPKHEAEWSYRHCKGWGPGVITRVGIEWKEDPKLDLLQRLQESNKRRMASQPLQWPSCGSVFKNPPNNKSGRLIDECGLKGYTVGGAQVSTLHANFIVNVGGASAQDIMAVVTHVQNTVQAKSGILLEPEFKWLGRK
jgi:UDP-N-acetylmuramate dehydrogenase